MEQRLQQGARHAEHARRRRGHAEGPGPRALRRRGLREAQGVKHGAAAGGRPERPDWTIDQSWEKYTSSEHALWRTLFERQTKLLPGHACDEFVDGMKRLPIGPEKIPDFRRLSDVLGRRTGCQGVAVPGLLPDGS